MFPGSLSIMLGLSFGVRGFWCGVRDSEFEVWGVELEFVVWGLGFGAVWRLGFRFQGFESRVSNSGFKIWVSGFGFRADGLGVRIEVLINSISGIGIESLV